MSLDGTKLIVSPTSKDVGNYTMTIILTDQNAAPLTSSFSLTIIITGNESDSTGFSAEAA